MSNEHLLDAIDRLRADIKTAALVVAAARFQTDNHNPDVTTFVSDGRAAADARDLWRACEDKQR